MTKDKKPVTMPKYSRRVPESALKIEKCFFPSPLHTLDRGR
ncbi:hypothetical protein [[Phormidium] sp. ETS-05]|nr:hypothetical protein [[Phormidium] sp. ETS-05]